MTDHPRVRRLRLCPGCCQPKDRGLLLCWDCHRWQTRVYGGQYSPYTDQLLEDIEYHLAPKTVEHNYLVR